MIASTWSSVSSCASSYTISDTPSKPRAFSRVRVEYSIAPPFSSTTASSPFVRRMYRTSFCISGCRRSLNIAAIRFQLFLAVTLSCAVWRIFSPRTTRPKNSRASRHTFFPFCLGEASPALSTL